ncbi:DUF192 domain-containing protein [Marinobacter sp. SS21]|uniref:DUF192 domain-containing protein n=1 Tax=Marinobacter sp. SS21 TaxID=2979460 RepID=UPI00232B631B|nr:DUF192 domain-containing protein [Marinobacter sp. SS21]MDC0664315.1 DUF192 domain-containing protein [Marinobacter sp. SS21]
MNRRRTAKPWGVMLVAWSLSACGDATLPSQPKLEIIPLELVTERGRAELMVEVAHTPAQRRIGLMGREVLQEDEGMLFLYPSERSGDTGFWMRNTLIPLDIAYLGEDGIVRAIRTMAPCPVDQTCPSYPAGAPYSAALEVNQGWFAKHGVTVGDRAEWEH